MTEPLILNNQLSARNEPFCLPAEAGIYPCPHLIAFPGEVLVEGAILDKGLCTTPVFPAGVPHQSVKLAVYIFVQFLAFVSALPSVIVGITTLTLVFSSAVENMLWPNNPPTHFTEWQHLL
jgi:hypothetical protein